MADDVTAPKRGGAMTPLGADLQTMLARAQQAYTDPALQAQRAAEDAEIERVEAAGREQRERARRAAVLAREHVTLREDVEAAIVTGSELEPGVSLSMTRRWIARADMPPVLVLAGATGCGKSVAAAWALAELDGKWRSADQLCRLFAADFGDQLDEQDAVTRCRLLVIDDLGTERDAARMIGVLRHLIENRQHSARRHRTIITTNVDRNGFAARYGDERIASRFDEAAQIVTWVPDNGPDLRRAKRPA